MFTADGNSLAKQRGLAAFGDHEGLLNVAEQLRLIPLHRHEVVPLLFDDGLAQFALAVGRVSHRGSKINDEVLTELCEHLPNLDSISLVLAAIADEARLVLNRLHRPDERRQVGDEILRHAATAYLRFGRGTKLTDNFMFPNITHTALKLLHLRSSHL